MPQFKKEGEVVKILTFYGREAVFTSTLFVFGVIVQQIYESGMELPIAFDEIEEWLRLVSLSYDDAYSPKIRVFEEQITAHCANKTPLGFWKTVGYAIHSTTTTKIRLRKNESISDYIFYILEKLSELSNLLNGISAYRRDGHEIVGNLMMDHLQGKL